MENRYEKIVFEAEEGVSFEVSEGTNGELVIKAVASTNVQCEQEELDKVEECINSEKCVIEEVETSYNYANPPVPEGYKHIFGDWQKGFVIERCSDGSQFVWVPVGNLKANGTLDGERFEEKFGTRLYHKDKNLAVNLENDAELRKQYESVKKYGGFYISRYNISKSSDEKSQSIKGMSPWVDITFNEAKDIAATIECNERITSHLVFGAEYDSVLEWLIESETKSLEEIEEDSTQWGNYYNREHSLTKIAKTGTEEEWSANNIYDLAGNVQEWTQEYNENKYCAIRGGDYYTNGGKNPVANRRFHPSGLHGKYLGFRAALCIE